MANRESEILDAAGRLRAGTPARSTGELTVTNLAREAGVSRNELYRNYRHLVAEFLAASRAVTSTEPSEVAMRGAVNDQDHRLARQRAEIGQLRKERDALASVVVALDLEVAELRAALESAEGVAQMSQVRGS